MDVDRISSLPDVILQHILSFLETPNAAKTSVLSKRWRYLWAYAPALDFNFDTFRWHRLYRGKSTIRYAISQHKSSRLRRVRLYGYQLQNLGFNLINEFLTFSTKCMVEELHLSFSSSYPIYELPNGIFSSGYLRVLELVECEINDIGSINLTMVETLSLNNVRAPDEVFNLLISGCKSVKKLEISDCEFVKKFEPTSFNKVSQIELCLPELWEMKLTDSFDLTKFIVDAPKLQHAHFQIFECEGVEFSLKNSRDLMYASLHYGEDSIGSFKDFVCELGVAKALELNCCFSEPLPLDLFDNCSLFYNVKQLDMTIHFPCSAVGILSIFPNLEDFTFQCQETNASKEGHNQKDEDDFNRFSVCCLRHSLRRIEFTDFQDLPCLFKLAKFLVEKALVLEKMQLTNCCGLYVKLRKMEGMLKSRRACKSAKIVFA